MEFELTPQTPAGERFVKLAEEHARFIAERADEHDQDGSFPYEAFLGMHESGLLRAAVPEELGGLGVTSLRELAIGLGRLARGDGSVAVALNLHLATSWRVARLWRATSASGFDPAATQRLLEMVAERTILASVVTELGTDVFHPLVELTRVPGGWELNGRKSFATLAPIADLFFVLCRCRDHVGQDLSRWVVVRKLAPGVHVLDNWDALGLRASGSHDLVFERVFVSDEQVLPPKIWGEPDASGLVNVLIGGIGTVATVLGVAERAHELALRTARTRDTGPHGRLLAEVPGVQRAIAENEVDLTTARSLVDRVAVLIDQVLDGQLEVPDVAELSQLNAQYQAARLEVSRRARDIVNRAMAVAGPTGYLSSHPLSRLYRDVRAGDLFEPYPPTEVHDYIGRLALGLDPAVAR